MKISPLENYPLLSILHCTSVQDYHYYYTCGVIHLHNTVPCEAPFHFHLIISALVAFLEAPNFVNRGGMKTYIHEIISEHLSGIRA